VYDGNSQALDHIMVSEALAQGVQPPGYDVVHVNSEFADQTSDHDPEVATLMLWPNDVTGDLMQQRSGLVLNRATQRFIGTVKLTQISGPAIVGQLQVLFEDLPAGVTLANATGTRRGVPYILVDATAPGTAIDVPVQFSNPSRWPIFYTVHAYAGQF
jgi:hypothetical protein